MIHLDNADKYKMEVDFDSVYTTRGQWKNNVILHEPSVNPNFSFLFKSEPVEFIRTVKVKLHW